MKISTLAQSIVFSAFAAVSLTAQQNSPSVTPVADDTVKVSTSLVQMDVVVTDKAGKLVTDLSPQDFIIFQDGKSQKITNLSYVDSVTSDRTEIVSSRKRGDKIPVPPSNVRSGRGRVITFVMDDGNCLASPDSLSLIRDSAKKFINERMLPDDRVAIYRTRGGASLMQMYTSNKEVLKKQLNKITLIVSSGCGSSFEALRDQSTIKYTGTGATTFETETDKAARRAREDRERDNQVAGTLGVLNFVVDRLKNVPQRKTLFLFSEGIIAKFDSNVGDALRELADKAARASVVINTMSAKGVTIPGMLTAQDEVLPRLPGVEDNTGLAIKARIEEEQELNQGISYLAYATGGRFVRTNDLAAEANRILDANAGYYLVGYEPDEETFKGKSYHKIDVRLTRPDLKVSFRKGFYGRSDKETQAVYKTPDSPLFQAIASPFDDIGLDIRMTTLLGKDMSKGNYLRAMFHIQGRDITFTDEANGEKKAVFDVVAVALDGKGKVVEEFNRTYPIRVPARGVATVKEYGLDFSTDVAFKKAGLYTFRLVVRDNNSKRLGTAGDFIDIPEPKSDDFYISGLITAEMMKDGKPRRPEGRPPNAAFAPIFSMSSPSIRQFKRGTTLSYVFTVNNARSNSATNGQNLTKEIRIYQNGRLLTAVDEQPLVNASPARQSSFDGFGDLSLTDAVSTGEYVLQVIIRDKIGNRISSQSIDFEVKD